MAKQKFSNKWIIALGILLIGASLFTLTGAYQPASNAGEPASAESASPDSQVEPEDTSTSVPPYKPVKEPQTVKAPAAAPFEKVMRMS
jgi:hypothetical protein